MLFDYENADDIVNNTIQNAWDTGIETGGFISNTLIAYNTISNDYVSGIGGWYGNSWLNNTVTGNNVSEVTAMFKFYNQGGLGAGETVLYFENNTFSDNTDSNIPSGSAGSTSAYIDMSYADNSSIPAGSVVAGNNVFSDNNFGVIQSAPELIPPGMIVDGGGNICGTVQFSGEAQLSCLQY
jgi:hypothetical protein